MRPRRARPGSAAPARGLGLLEVMIITFIVASALLAGFVALRARQPALAAQDQADALAQADRFVVGFVASNNRLPCPDIDNDGYEDCGSRAQKGRLPYRTLGLEGSEYGPGVGQLRYLVQINALDLTLPAQQNNRFEPVAFDSQSGTYTGTDALSNFGTSADFCQGLATASSTAYNSLQAQATTLGAPGYPVAYALVHPGARDADGDGDVFDGLNSLAASAAAPNQVEMPSRASGPSSYDDQVRLRSYGSLALELDCARFMSSENSVSLANDVMQEVQSQLTTEALEAGLFSAINLVKAGVAAWGINAAVTQMSTASAGLATASTALAAAIASCVVLIGCAEIPVQAAAVAAFATAEAAGAAAIAAQAAALTADLAAFGMTLTAAIQAGVDTQPPVVDISAALSAAQANQATAQSDYNTANANLTAANNALGSAASSEQSGVSQWQSTANSLLAQVNGLTTDAVNYSHCGTTYADGAMDIYLNNLLSAAQALVQAQQALDQAKANLNSVSANSSQVQQQLTQVGQQISSLQAQEAAADLAEQQSLQGQISRLQTQQAQLENQSATATQALTSANSAYSASLQNTLSAQVAYVQSYNALTSAFGNLQYTECATAAGQKAKVPSPLTVTVDESGAIAGVTSALFGSLSSETSAGDPSTVLFNWSHLTGAYFNWQSALLNQQQAQSQLTQTQARLTAANNAVASLQSISAGEPAGTGSAYQIFQNAASILKAVDQRGAIP